MGCRPRAVRLTHATVRGNAPSSLAGQVTALAGAGGNVQVELAGSRVLIRREADVVLALFMAAAAPA
jgi:hypothetical protein